MVLALASVCGPSCTSPGTSPVPARLGDQEFRALSEALSEPAGEFTHSDNLVSNETYFVHLARQVRPSGGIYIGVGPEQNYSYIARLRPEMAFIIDIRQENRDLHLIYKALFEASADRAEFVSRLFSRPLPSELGPSVSVDELFARLGAASPDPRLYDATLASIYARLDAHGLELTPHDREWIRYALTAFYSDGPEIHYARLRPTDVPGPRYRVLMTEVDVSGQPQSYLASEEAFAFVKELHARNLIVPVVGDFAGPTALRRAGEYARQHGEVVRLFYASNVEVYLNRARQQAFCANLATMPHDSRSWFVVSKSMQTFSSKLKACQSTAPPRQ